MIINTLLFRSCVNNILVSSRRCSSKISKPIFNYLGKPEWENKIFILDEFGTFTYGELNYKSNNVAKVLHNELGLSSTPHKQHAISFLCGNNSTHCNTLFGIWKSGNIGVPLCKTHPSPLLEYCIQDSESSAIITTKCFVDQIYPFASKCDIKLFLLEDMVDDVNVSNNTVDMDSHVQVNNIDMLNRDALILYTSGTTGSPKGVVHTHNSLISQINTMLGPWRWNEKDCILHVLPLHHVHGLVNSLLCPLAIGARVIMLPKFDAGEVWKILLSDGKDHLGGVTLFMAVPPIYAKLTEFYKANESTFLDVDVKEILMENIRLMVSGSSALPNKTLSEWNSVSGHMILERYGMTEIGMALGNPYNPTYRNPGFVGNPFPGVEVRIVESGTSNVMATGNHSKTTVNLQNRRELSGDLQVKTPAMFRNYFNKEEATEQEFTEDGWFNTGDIATYVVSKDAYIIVGRSSVDIIKSGGYKIGALEVERILLQHPSIKEVAVVGVDDNTWGQRVGVVVVLKDPTNTSFDLLTLRTWANDKMSSYMIPRVLKIMEELPRNTMGKVNKKELVKIAFSN